MARIKIPLGLKHDIVLGKAAAQGRIIGAASDTTAYVPYNRIRFVPREAPRVEVQFLLNDIVQGSHDLELWPDATLTLALPVPGLIDFQFAD